MINVTRIGGSVFVLNAIMIEHVESTPDTVITMVSGKKYVVKESTDQVVRDVSEFYRSIGLVGACFDGGRMPEHNEP